MLLKINELCKNVHLLPYQLRSVILVEIQNT